MQSTKTPADIASELMLANGAKLEPIPASTRVALERNGWHCGKHTATRLYFSKLRNNGTIKAAIDTAGIVTVYWLPDCEPIGQANESGADAKTRICMAAMEANEIAWAARDGVSRVTS